MVKMQLLACSCLIFTYSHAMEETGGHTTLSVPTLSLPKQSLHPISNLEESCEEPDWFRKLESMLQTSYTYASRKDEIIPPQQKCLRQHANTKLPREAEDIASIQALIQNPTISFANVKAALEQCYNNPTNAGTLKAFLGEALSCLDEEKWEKRKSSKAFLSASKSDVCSDTTQMS